MKKFLFALMIVLLMVSTVSAQWVDGRRIMKGTIKNTSLAADIIGGEEMEEPSWSWWVPVAADSCDSDGYRGANGWYLDASNPPTVGTGLLGQYFAFDATSGGTDEHAYFNFAVPAQYEPDHATVNLYWYHADDDGAAADVVEWQGALQAVALNETLFVAGTALTAVEHVCAKGDSFLYVTTLNLEVEDIAAGDLAALKIGVDCSDSELDNSERAYLIGMLINWYIKYDD